MRALLLSVLILVTAGRMTAFAAEPLTLEVLDHNDKVIETLVIPGDQIRDVDSTFAQTKEPIFQIRFGNKARKQFGEMTKRHIGKRMRLRVGDEILIAGAIIREPILGGSVQVSGISKEKADAAKKRLGH